MGQYLTTHGGFARSRVREVVGERERKELNGCVSTAPDAIPEAVPVAPLRAVIAVWVAALVAGVVAAIVAPAGTSSQWFALTAGLFVTVSFAVQLAFGRPRGFIVRVAMSVVGSLFVLGVVSAVDAVIALLSPVR